MAHSMLDGAKLALVREACAKFCPFLEWWCILVNGHGFEDWLAHQRYLFPYARIRKWYGIKCTVLWQYRPLTAESPWTWFVGKRALPFTQPRLDSFPACFGRRLLARREALLQDPRPRMPSRSDIVLITRTVTVGPDTQLMPAVHPTKI